MRAIKRSPLFLIALLSFAVLFAHTGRAAHVQHIAPVRPPCARKVAAAQPDAEKKLAPAIKRLIFPGRRVHFHTSFAHTLGFSRARAAALHAANTSGQLALTRGNAHVPPQHRSFTLRI
jgi:hypothetical protein